MIYEIKNEVLIAKFDSLGAQLISLMKGDKQLIWQGDEQIWKGHSPLLFPICGRLFNAKYVYENKEYNMGLHGFARNCEFEVEQITKDSVTFLLKKRVGEVDNYPFDFEFAVTYKIADNQLITTYLVKNNGEKTMWFSLGSHEGLNIDSDLSNYYLSFEKQEDFENLNLYGDTGLLDGTVTNLTNGDDKTILNLSWDLFKSKDTVIFKQINSRTLYLYNKRKGQKVVKYEFDAPNILLWTATNGKYICIEPWLNLPDYYNVECDMAKKYGVKFLTKGNKYTNTHTITFF